MGNKIININEKKLKLEDLEFEMKKGKGGDYFEHDLSRFALLVQKNYPDHRLCFDFAISQVVSKHGVCHPVIILENESGYIPTTFDIGTTHETAIHEVQLANNAIGLSQDQINMIIQSSMKMG